jgi:nicotinamide phosphoribosyltransferase
MVSTTVTLGVGSFTYQYQTRDTFGSAMKATWAEIDGEGVNVFKDPVTDDGTKKSATGRLSVHMTHGEVTDFIEKATPLDEEFSALQPIWQNGKFLKYQGFDEVRRVLSGS